MIEKMRKINYKSDFELLVTWVGEDAITPFSLNFEVGADSLWLLTTVKTGRSVSK